MEIPPENERKMEIELPKNHKATVIFNDKHNLEWHLKIPAGNEVEIPFSYAVSWPSGSDISDNY